MGTISYGIPQSGLPNASEDPKIATALTTLLTLVNGNLDSTNVAATLAQSAGVNGASTVKGAIVNAGPGTRTNTAYGALNDAPDQVAGIVLPTNGLITVWYQATWQESVAGAARAAIFIGSNQLQIAGDSGPPPSPANEAAATASGGANTPRPLASAPIGLVSMNVSYTGDVSTGQAVGLLPAVNNVQCEVLGVVRTLGAAAPTVGPCYIFAAAGTYAISVQFKASSGTVTASNRRLWVKAESFA